MKTKMLLFFSLFLSIMLTSCASMGNGTASNAEPNEAKLTTNLNAIVDGWNTRKTAEYFKAYISPDFVRTSQGKPHFTGIDGFVKLINDFSAGYPKQQVTIDPTSITVKGNKVFTKWIVNTGKFPENQATPTEVTVSGFSAWTFDDNGMLIGEDAYWDDLYTLKQLGTYTETK